MSETAGEMASLMDAFLSAGIEYTGRAGHIKKVVAYLQRTTRLKYRRVDIERVCEFLGHLEDKAALLEKIVKLGVKQHPRSVAAQLPGGAARDGTRDSSTSEARRREIIWRQPGSWRKHRPSPAETALLPQIKSALTLLNEMSSRANGLPGVRQRPAGVPLPGPGR